MYIRIRYELESFQALKKNNDVDRVLGFVLDHAEKLVKIVTVLKNCQHEGGGCQKFRKIPESVYG